MTAKPVENCKAEVVAVGDEIVTGQRLDTNTQWICQQLGELGVAVQFLSAVGDCLADHVLTLKQAVGRVDLIVMTGGLGPTADDLTREAIAGALAVPLELSERELSQLQQIFQRAGRPMPARNLAQAMFPSGSVPIANPEGTAPGIDIMTQRADGTPVRIIALPGVPAEMKQMWPAVEQHLREWTQTNSVFYHHTLHCFGAGESAIEEMLPNLIERGRDPSVGITASQATISLRVATRAPTLGECQLKMEPTLRLIRSQLGNLIFGENGQSLPEVVAQQLLRLNLKLAIVDFGLNGRLQSELNQFGPVVERQQVLTSAEFEENPALLDWAEAARFEAGVPVGIAIGWIDRESTKVVEGDCFFQLAIVTEGPTTVVTGSGLGTDFSMSRPTAAFEASEIPIEDWASESLLETTKEQVGGESPTSEIIAEYSEVTATHSESGALYQLRYWGHSAWRDERALKQVLNQIRLHLS